MKQSQVGILSLILGLVFSYEIKAAQVSVNVSRENEAIHLEFKGLNQWDYNLEKKQNKNQTTVEIEIPRLSEPSVMSLSSYKGPDVESISVQHNGADGKDIIIMTLKGEEFDTFDYLTDQPSRLVVDIYRNIKNEKKKENKVANKSLKPEHKISKTAAKELPKKVKNKSNRTPSSTDQIVIASQSNTSVGVIEKEEQKSGVFDAADPNFDRFRVKDYEIKPESIIAAKENYYLDFPMLRMKLPEFDKLNLNRPIYEISSKDNDENKQARLLLTLYEKKRYNVFLKAVDWFFDKYPSSEYSEIARFMWADVHYLQWLEGKNPVDFDLAMTRYRQAIEKFPNSLLVERTQMLIGFSSLERGDYLTTLKLFQSHIRNHPKSMNRDLAQLAVAEAYQKIARFDEAMSSYEEIEKDAFDKKSQILATYLKGDIELTRGNYQKSIDLYKTALQKYPQSAQEMSNAYYNQASAYFKLLQTKESLNTYIEFVKLFPTHEYAGYAMTRIGELLDIMGVEKSKVIGAYFETQFRYGELPSASVARMRILASKMKSMKVKESEKAVSEIMELAKKSPLPKVEQFATVLISEGLSSRSEYEKSVSTLIKFYQSNPTTSDTDLLKNRITKDINLEIKNQVDGGQFIDALKTHTKYVSTWLKGSNRIDTTYNIGRAFEQAGVFKESEKLYSDALNRMLAIQGTQAGKERNIFEKLPSSDVVSLRLANTEYQIGNFSQSHEYMKSIRDPGALSLNEQVERAQLISSLLEKKGDLTSAIRHLVDLIKVWKGVPVLLAPAYLQLADLEFKQNKKEDAIQSLQKIDLLMTDSQEKISKTIHAKSLEQLGNLYFAQNNVDQALKVYMKLLELYETSIPLSSIRYKVGQIYFKRGDLQKASDVWNGFKNEKSETWKKMAQEQLKNSEWNGEYKKYINRIPAMTDKASERK